MIIFLREYFGVLQKSRNFVDENQEAIDLIIEEFDLPRDKTVVQKASHWDIGQTWASM